MITKQQINKLFTPEQLALFTSKDALAMFVAQNDYESCGFRVVVEDLNYSASRALEIFSKYVNIYNVNQYAQNPEALGNLVYANRMGNGDEDSGDGYKYRGRGYPQLTGKNNYAAFGNKLGIDLINNPDLVATKYPMESAIWFFQDRNILNNTDIEKVTNTVNGSLHTVNARLALFNYYKSIL